MDQLNLFEDDQKETKLGHSSISYKNALYMRD